MTGRDFAQRIGELVAAGQRIEAIKELREATGLGLAEARDVIDAVAKGQPVPAHLHEQLERTATVSRGDDRAQDGLPEDVHAAAAAGDRIGAIKLLRQHRGLGLKEAKDLLDRAVPVAPGNKRGCLLPLLFGCVVGWSMLSRRG